MGVLIEREATIGLPDEVGWAPEVSHSTELCDGSRCRHTTEAVGIFPAMVLYVDLDARTSWWVHPAHGTCARLETYAAADRLWGVDLLEPLPFQPVTAPPPAGLPAGVSGWSVQKPSGIHLTVWVQPGLPVDADHFARRTAVRVRGADGDGVAAALRALPGYPVEVRSGAPYRPGASTDVRIRVTRLEEVPVDPALLELPACREISEGAMLRAAATGEAPEAPEPPDPVEEAQVQLWRWRHTPEGTAERAASPDVVFPGVGVGPLTLGAMTLQEVAAQLPPERCRATFTRGPGRFVERGCTGLQERHALHHLEVPGMTLGGSGGQFEEVWIDGEHGLHTLSGVTVGQPVDAAVAAMGLPPDHQDAEGVRWDAVGFELTLQDGVVVRMHSWAVEGTEP